MGQLIKLQDYISRYEMDVYRYPSQYIRLKKQHWQRVKTAWENNEFHLLQIDHNEGTKTDWFEDDRKRRSLKNLFSLKKRHEKITQEHDEATKLTDENEEFNPTFHLKPETLDDLKVLFLEKLFHFQMRWASSTIREKSYIDKFFYRDADLKYFLQRFPDTFLVLYKPILLLKSAPVEMEVILITPTSTFCITLLEGDQDSVFLGSKERFWVEKKKDGEKKVLNPLLSLRRMEKVVNKLFQHHDVEMPIKKVVLNRTGYFDYPSPPYDVEFIEKRNYENWFQALRNLTSPLKHIQLKAAQALLIHSQTTCVKRLDWEEINDQEFE